MKKINLLLLAVFALGIFSCTKDKGTLTVTYQEAEALYGDMDAIRAEPLNEEARVIDNPGKIYLGDDFILIGEERKGIHVIDNTDVTNPTPSHFINIPGNQEFIIDGTTMYAESYNDMLKIDISNPQNVSLLARASNIFQDIEEIKNEKGESLIGFSFTEVTKEVDENSNLMAEINDGQFVYYDFAQNIIPKSIIPASFSGTSNDQTGTVNRIAYTKEHVYLIGASKMAIVDDSNGSFETVSHNNYMTLPFNMETIFPYQNKLFIGSRSSMDIYDISNPSSPYNNATFIHATACDPVLPDGDVAYITLRTADFSDCGRDINALITLNVENVNSPNQTSEIEMKSPFGMTLINNYLYVGEGAYGLKIFDVTNREEPELLSYDDSIVAYDVIEHPTNPGLILVTGENELNEYSVDTDLNLSLQGSINY